MDAATSAVWITGAGGLIGSHLARLAARALPGRRILPIARPDLDLTDTGAVARRFQQDQPGIVLHCAALSRSPACQADPARARTERRGPPAADPPVGGTPLRLLLHRPRV